VIANVVGVRNGDGWFSRSDLTEMFESLRLPAPNSLPRDLSRLVERDLIRKRAAEPSFSLTPKGREHVNTLIGDFDYRQIEAELVGTPGVEYAQVRHTVIPPSLAPPTSQQAIKRHLERFPFETNVFCMTRFPRSSEEGEPDPQQAVIGTVREVVQQHGLTLHLASDRKIEDELFPNVAAHMWTCQYGIGLLENLGPRQDGLNDNVLIELGSMLVIGRRCAILKDHRAPHPPSDLAGHIYKSVDFDNPLTIAEATHRWIAEDLALGSCSNCPPGNST
jgi:hypothetical protein